MSEKTHPEEGKFIWYELLSTDPDAAQRFYGEVVGWACARKEGEKDYRILSAPDGDAIAGLMKSPEGMGGMWLAYLFVADVDASVKAIAEAGGRVHMPATDMPGVGRMAMVAGPDGACFYVMRPIPPEDPDAKSRAFLDAKEATPGHVVWNELSAEDPKAASGFYEAQFGWGQEGAMPMGDLGDYLFLQSGATPIGAAMGRVPNGRDGWQFYFMVDEIDAATARLREAGGTVIQEPHEIPGGSFSVVAEDPQGVRFGLVGARRS